MRAGAPAAPGSGGFVEQGADFGDQPVIFGPGGADAKGGLVKPAVLGEGFERAEMLGGALPERIEQVEAIPKTSVGKLDKKAIRAQYAG